MTEPVDPFDQALIEGLRHPRPDVAEICATVLGRRGTRAAVPALIAALREREHDHTVQAAAATALGRIGDPAAWDALVEAARSGAVVVRRAALCALVRIDPARARLVLAERAHAETASGVRTLIAQLLARKECTDDDARTPDGRAPHRGTC